MRSGGKYLGYVNDCFQPVSAVAKPDLNDCSTPDPRLLQCSRGPYSG